MSAWMDAWDSPSLARLWRSEIWLCILLAWSFSVRCNPLSVLFYIFQITDISSQWIIRLYLKSFAFFSEYIMEFLKAGAIIEGRRVVFGIIILQTLLQLSGCNGHEENWNAKQCLITLLHHCQHLLPMRRRIISENLYTHKTMKSLYVFPFS